MVRGVSALGWREDDRKEAVGFPRLLHGLVVRAGVARVADQEEAVAALALQDEVLLPAKVVVVVVVGLRKACRPCHGRLLWAEALAWGGRGGGGVPRPPGFVPGFD